MPRSRVLPLLLLPLLAGCGTLRLYDGPERPREEVARVHETADLLSYMSSCRAVVVGVDGQPIEDHSESTLELLPGPHALEVEGKAYGTPVKGTLRFTAAAGGEYEMWLSTGGHSRGAIVLRDVEHEEFLADTEPQPEQARSVELDLEPEWHVVQWHLDAAQAGQVWVPAGQTETTWTESLSFGAQPIDGGDASAVLDAQVELLRGLAARQGPGLAVQVIDSGPSWRTMTYAGKGADGQPSWSLTCIRVVDGVIHRLSYSARSQADYAAREARWRSDFLSAPVSFPQP